MINEGNQRESSADRAVRFAQEEDELQKLLTDVSSDAADLLIEQLARKHKYEMEKEVILSLSEFADLESGVTGSKYIPPPSAIEDVAETIGGDEFANDVVSPDSVAKDSSEGDVSESALGVATSTEPVASSAKEDDGDFEHQEELVARVVDTINKMGLTLRQRGDAETFLADQNEIAELTEKLETMANDKIMNAEGRSGEKRELQARLRYLESERERATADIENIQGDLDSGMSEVLRDFANLPTELQDGIFYVKDDVLRKYGIKARRVANDVASAVGKRRMDAKIVREFRLSEKQGEKDEKARLMTPENLARVIGTPEEAAYSRKDIEEILAHAGIPFGDIGAGLRVLKDKYSIDAKNEVPKQKEKGKFEQMTDEIANRLRAEGFSFNKPDTSNEDTLPIPEGERIEVDPTQQIEHLREIFGEILHADEVRQKALGELRGNNSWLGLNRGLKSMKKRFASLPPATGDTKLNKQRAQLERDIADF